MSLTTETESQDCMAGDDALPQAILMILERVAETNTGFGGRWSVMERLRSNRAKLFRGVTRVILNVAEYWIEATERIMDDLDSTLEQKLKGPGKHVGASYVEAHRREFLNLTEGDQSVAEYEVKFLRLSHYARDMVASEYERCVCFENGLRDSLRVLIALQREREFLILVEKVKITEEFKHAERQNRDRERGRNKRDSEPSSSIQRPKKRPKLMGRLELGPLLLLLDCNHVLIVVDAIRTSVREGLGQVYGVDH
ncbi:uncharacterized protein [Gossypium hirsutum]|uniref:Retrotransposon gag domain-containing protein n=1 Tax=Gossypium hirsutum TaxID=3635 RepID=A0A1U8M3S6_GOSHI|nr:uncharacterized protein LOC107932392 [Gossypium hirsutum]